MLDLVERVRTLARRPGEELATVLRDVAPVDAIRLVRAFTLYFHLANATEQVHRIEELNQRTADAGRVTDTVARLLAGGHDVETIAGAVARTELRPVFTAHPTEASRRSIRDKLTEISTWLERRQHPATTPTEQRRIDRRIDQLIDAIWQTDELRRERPDALRRSPLGALRPRAGRPPGAARAPRRPRPRPRARRRLAAARCCARPLRQLGRWRPGWQPERHRRDHGRGPRPCTASAPCACSARSSTACAASSSTSDRIRPASDELQAAVDADRIPYADVHARLGRRLEGEWYRLRLAVVAERLRATETAPDSTRAPTGDRPSSTPTWPCSTGPCAPTAGTCWPTARWPGCAGCWRRWASTSPRSTCGSTPTRLHESLARAVRRVRDGLPDRPGRPGGSNRPPGRRAGEPSPAGPTRYATARERPAARLPRRSATRSTGVATTWWSPTSSR